MKDESPRLESLCHGAESNRRPSYVHAFDMKIYKPNMN